MAFTQSMYSLFLYYKDMNITWSLKTESPDIKYDTISFVVIAHVTYLLLVSVNLSVIGVIITLLQDSITLIVPGPHLFPVFPSLISCPLICLVKDEFLANV